MKSHQSSRICIIGLESFSEAVAYNLMVARVAEEITLVDWDDNDIYRYRYLNLKQANELMKNGVVVRAGTFKEAGQSDLVIFTGSDDDTEEDRDKKLLDLHEEIGSIASKMSPVRADIKMIIACCDEVDFLVQSVQNCFSGVSPSRIFGFGAATLATVPTNFWITEMNKSKRIVSGGIFGGEDDVVRVWDSEAVNNDETNNLMEDALALQELEKRLDNLGTQIEKDNYTYIVTIIT